MNEVEKPKLKNESVYARAALLIILLPLSLMVVVKLFVIFSIPQSNKLNLFELIKELFRSSDWSLANGMVYVSILIGIYESTQGRKVDGIRLLYRGVKLGFMMLMNFLVYFCATIYPNHVALPLLQLLLFLQAIWFYYRYQKDIFIIKNR